VIVTVIGKNFYRVDSKELKSNFYFLGQFFHAAAAAGNGDFQFQHFPSEFSSSPESSVTSFMTGNPQNSGYGASGSAILALPTPPNDARDDPLTTTTTSGVQCKSEPHPSPTEQQQQQQQQQQQINNGPSWTPLTPPSSNTITGF
jgi:hypothetical protein